MDQLRRVCSVFLCFLMLALPAISADQQAGQINALVPAATRNAQPAKAKDALQWNDLLKTEQAGRMRITQGSVNPWSTSVTKITQNVRKTIRFFGANGLPSANTSGNDSAAASAMTPRIPVHPTTKVARAVGVFSF